MIADHEYWQTVYAIGKELARLKTPLGCAGDDVVRLNAVGEKDVALSFHNWPTAARFLDLTSNIPLAEMLVPRKWTVEGTVIWIPASELPIVLRHLASLPVDDFLERQGNDDDDLLATVDLMTAIAKQLHLLNVHVNFNCERLGPGGFEISFEFQDARSAINFEKLAAGLDTSDWEYRKFSIVIPEPHLQPLLNFAVGHVKRQHSIAKPEAAAKQS